MIEAFQKAVDVVGSQAAMAKAIGVKPQHVWNWLNRDKDIPAEKVLAIEAATADPETGVPAVSRHDLRPDIFGAPSTIAEARA